MIGLTRVGCLWPLRRSLSLSLSLSLSPLSTLPSQAPAAAAAAGTTTTTTTTNPQTTPVLDDADHRAIGARQRLFCFKPCCAGQAIFLPHGQRIFNKLMEYMRGIYRKTGYDEVQTPLIFSNDLWKTSGHYQHYHKDMFAVSNSDGSAAFGASSASPNPVDECGSSSLGLKPMNCPAHCLVYEHEPRSYKHLPLRIADFSPLHRNEASGGLGGLTRLRRFHQDDAHIFCRPDQTSLEIQSCLQSIRTVYSKLDFEYEVQLSTKPENALGDEESWARAQSALVDALEKSGQTWTISKGDGAFYGPKIDIIASDVMGRKHQCGTIQLDFQLPQRFALSYMDSDGKQARPVLIHRAILGSLERMIAIIAEHTKGKWPLWLSPRQVLICPVSSKFAEFSEKIRSSLVNGGFDADVDASDESVSLRLRHARPLYYNYVLVVGERELSSGNVSPKARNGDVLPTMSVDAFQKHLNDAL